MYYSELADGVRYYKERGQNGMCELVENFAKKYATEQNAELMAENAKIAAENAKMAAENAKIAAERETLSAENARLKEELAKLKK